MYQQHLIQLYKDKAHRRPLEASEVLAAERNPACGDEISLGFRIEDGRITEIAHQSQACSVTLASARAMCGAVEGLTPEEARERLGAARAFFDGEGEWAESWGVPDLPALGEVRAFPMRMACVRLPWDALAVALARVS